MKSIAEIERDQFDIVHRGHKDDGTCKALNSWAEKSRKYGIIPVCPVAAAHTDEKKYEVRVGGRRMK